MTETELLTEKLPTFKLNIGQARDCYKRHKKGESIHKLAKEFNVHHETIEKAIRRYAESKLPKHLRNIYYGGTSDKKWAQLAKKKNNHIIEKWCK